MTVLQILNRLKEMDPDKKIRMFDFFGQMFTPGTHVNSWRGSYEIPAIVVKPITNLNQCISVEEFIDKLKECDGKEVQGWKGGNFTLSELDTLFLVTDWGTAGDLTTISEIYDDGYCVLEQNAKY